MTSEQSSSLKLRIAALAEILKILEQLRGDDQVDGDESVDWVIGQLEDA